MKIVFLYEKDSSVCYGSRHSIKTIQQYRIATTLFVALSLVSYQHPCGLVGLEGDRREKGRGNTTHTVTAEILIYVSTTGKVYGRARKNLPPSRFVKKIICPQAGWGKKKLAPGQTRQDFSCFSFLLRPFLHKVYTTEIGINWLKVEADVMFI
jgi:hypothetical protein